MPDMEWGRLIAEHWFEGLQSLGIVLGFFFTGTSLLVEAKARRINNLLTITDNHRALWTQLYQKPELSRVLEASVDVAVSPVTPDEELFVMLVVLHLNSAHETMRAGMFSKPEGMAQDVQEFFGLPIPKAVWLRIRHFQNASLRDFVERPAQTKSLWHRIRAFYKNP